jgi:carbon-monoxide dehydrogenase large subunit
VNTAVARAAPGVCAVFTGDELAARNPRTMVCEAEIPGAGGKPLFKPRQTILATDAVRYVGEPIAMVIAATLNQAREAADLIEIEFDELPVVTHAARALEPDSPVLWTENGSNLAVFWESRPRAKIDRILAASPRRVWLELVNNRVIPSPMEPRAAVAIYDRDRDRITLYTPSQGGRRLHTRLCQFLGVARECVRVVSADTGGGFGIRSSTSREQLAIVWAAHETGLTIRWRGDRCETFVSDYHGRDQINRAEMGLDEDGRVTALRVETILNLGAFLTENGPRLPNGGWRMYYSRPLRYRKFLPVGSGGLHQHGADRNLSRCWPPRNQFPDGTPYGQRVGCMRAAARRGPMPQLHSGAQASL